MPLNETDPVRVLVAEDNAPIRAGLRTVLCSDNTVQIVTGWKTATAASSLPSGWNRMSCCWTSGCPSLTDPRRLSSCKPKTAHPREGSHGPDPDGLRRGRLHRPSLVRRRQRVHAKKLVAARTDRRGPCSGPGGCRPFVSHRATCGGTNPRHRHRVPFHTRGTCRNLDRTRI